MSYTTTIAEAVAELDRYDAIIDVRSPAVSLWEQGSRWGSPLPWRTRSCSRAPAWVRSAFSGGFFWRRRP